MKKILPVFIFLILFIYCFSFYSFAYEYYDFSELKNELSNSIADVLTDDVKKAFDELGIRDLDFESIYKVSFKKLFTYFTPLVKEKAEKALGIFLKLFSVLLILSSFVVLNEGGGLGRMIMLFGGAVSVLISVSGITDTINSCLSVIKLSGSFIASFVPIFTLIVSFSGNTASALVYNSFVLGVAEIISALINGILVDFLGAFLCLGISFSFNETLNTKKLINALNKTVTFVLTISGSIFSGVLTVKNIMAVSLDGLSVKGVRFLLSSFIPVIGASISEAYSSVLGSINLIKGSVAVIGILAVVIINIPVVFETFIYYFSFSALSYVAEILNCNQISDLFKTICSVFRFLLIFVVFQLFILIISTGIMLTFKNT